MPYLYGDSSESGLEQDYLHFLKNFLSFATKVLKGEARVIKAKSHSSSTHDTADQNRAQLDRLRRMIHSTIKEASEFIPLKSQPHRAAQAIWASTETIIKESVEKLSINVVGAKKSSTDLSLSERNNVFHLLEDFLIEQDIPGTDNFYDLHLGSNKESYAIRQSSYTPFGIETIFNVDGSKQGTFSKIAKIKDFKQGLKIQAPSISGLVVKTKKVKPHPLDDFYLVSFRTTKTSIIFVLRTERHLDSDGFDIEIHRKGNVVKMASHTKGDPNPKPFEVNLQDVPHLIALAEDVEKQSNYLTTCKSEMLEAKLNNEPIKHLSHPTELLEQIVEHISPVVRSISERSLSEKELVLKKVLEDDKREEIYLSKKELLDKISEIPEKLQHVFNPLGLGATTPLIHNKKDDSEQSFPLATDPPTVINDELTNRFISEERGIRVDTDDIVDDTIMDADTAPPPPSYEPKNSMLASEAKKIVADPNTVDEAIENIKDND